MKIITSNPIFESDNDKSPSDMYYEARGRRRGKKLKRGLKKAVGYIPAVAVGRAISDSFSNADDFGPQLPSSTPSFPGPYSNEFLQSQQNKGLTWDKVKGAWTKAQESGLIDKGMQLFGGLFGKGKPKGKPPISTGGNTKPPTKKKEKGMSTTTIVLIGVGVLVAGFAIYKLSKK